MTDELKPVRCGCGGEAEVNSLVTKGYYIKCSKCGIMQTVGKYSEAEAITAWNRAMGAKDINVPDKFATDTNVGGKETVIIEPFTTDMNHVGYCKCGHLVNADWKYCPNCDCRLEWKYERHD